VLYRRGNFSGTMDRLICDALRGELDAEIALSPGFRWGASFLPNQPLTMEDVLSETAITYPETYVQKLTGTEIKNTLEDVCDNLFNPDPYYQQGGDMVRVGGFAYTCTPAESVGRRISDLKLDNGRPLVGFDLSPREPMLAGRDADDVLEYERASPAATEILAGLSPAQAAELTRQVRDRLVAYASPDGVVMPGAAWLVTAQAA